MEGEAIAALYHRFPLGCETFDQRAKRAPTYWGAMRVRKILT